MTSSPWIDQFRSDWTDAELDTVIAKFPAKLPDLASLSSEEAQAHLQMTLAELTVPSAQMRAGVRRLHVLAKAAATQLFPSQHAYLQRAYSAEPAPCTLPILCFTGLAGTGKTQLLLAFHRSLPCPRRMDIPNHASIHIVPAYALKARSGVGLKQILKPVFAGVEQARCNLFGRTQHQLALDGVCLITGDELQFVSQSAAATQAANMLQTLSLLGPPFCFASNYSLLHRLMNRPQEQRDRLLSDVVVLSPEEVGSDDWNSYVEACLKIDKSFDELRSRSDIAAEFHRLAFGIKRSVRRLMVLSYGCMRERNADCVTLADLQKAYLSLQFSASRADVELLTAGFVGELRKRKDLWCPLDVAGLDADDRARRREEARELALSEAALRASMTEGERESLQQANSGSDPPAKPERPKRPKVTADGLRSGAAAFAQGGRRRGAAA